MRIAIENLPDDIETLKQLVIEKQALIEEREARLEHQRAEELYLRTWIEKLKLEIARLRRMQFGRSSEKLSERIEQLELIVEDLETSQAQASPPRAPSAQKTPPARKPLPEHLPRETVTHEPAVTAGSILPGRGCGRNLGLSGGVVHVFVRGSASSCAALHQAGQTSRPDHSSARLPYEERAQALASGVRAAP